MKKTIIKFGCCIIFLISLSVTASFASTKKEVIIIVPMRHASLSEIVSGIKESLKGTETEITVKNAHGDNTIMLGLIKQIQDHDAIFMPIGTMASQMTISHIKNKQIICVAADLAKEKSSFITGINDEINASTILKTLPKLSKIAVIYSASEKVTPEIENLKIFAKNNKIILHPMMVQTLTDLPLVVHNAPKDIQAFFVLKDHLIVSGINILIQEANKRSIPVITSDEGSVKEGATLAVGVVESYIGVEAGNIVKSILAGIKLSDMEYKTMNNLVLFINGPMLKKQNVFTADQIAKIRIKHIECENK